MLKETRRYGLRVEALKLSAKTKDEAPIWLSKTVDITPKEENSAAMKHLREHHRVRNMGDLKGLSINNARGCKTHTRCMQAVNKLTVKTQPRFNIRFQTPLLQGATEPDNLDFTATRKEKARRDRATGMPTDLDPNFTYQGDLHGALRMFQDSKREDLLPAYRTGEARNMTNDQTVVWTDGSTNDYGKSTQRVGFGVWSETPHLRVAARLTSEPVTNNRAELAAIVWALERAPKNEDLLVNTDSQYAVTGFTLMHQTWEDRGWLRVENADLWKRGLYLVRSRTSLTTIAKVKAHSGIEGNERADELAKAGAESTNDDFPSLEVPVEWTLNGARLQSLSFHDAYQWVRAERPEPKATRAPENLKRIQETLETEHGIRTTGARIWLDLRRPAIRREISDFLWTMIHGRSQCGSMFRNWGPEWEELQFCTCGAVETMEHLLTQCGDALWRIRLWNKASALMKGSKLIEESKCVPPSFEEIMGAASVRLRTPAATRLWSTIVTETAFTIWKLRNRSRFDRITVSSKMAFDVWRTYLEKRAKTDLTIARLKGPSSTARDKRTREIETAWGSLLSLRNGVTVWNSADYG
ncbi:hypothetical protein FRC05_002249 [Tulasnella sp. 425]|nr:hypothetical protein FRC05_002249 [Tulasnella sp. 425]